GYLAEFNGDFLAFVKASTSKTKWGLARTDAFGMIFNRVSAIDMKFPPNNQPPDAPVSYPHLWTSWRFDAVQWNAAVPNGSTLKNLGRNVGEVLGVFGKAELKRPTVFHPYYTSTVRTKNLLAMENQLWSLQAPKWPELMFGVPNSDQVKAGQQVYEKNCQGCHQQVPGGSGIINVVRIPLKEIGTDPVMATNALSKRWSVQLTGTAMPPLFGTKLKQEDLGVSLLANAVVGSLIGSVVAPDADQGLPKLWKKKTGGAWKATASGNYEDTEVTDETASDEQVTTMHADLKAYQEEVQAKQASADDLLVYKARPLDGIWATGPFLHNGSVPSLYALLNSKARPAKFKVGTQAFDPTVVGFKDEGAFEYDTTQPGNGNGGHTYGDSLSDKQRWDLIEYLKTL
ncbi:MAG TPA: cytochrome c, partial [Candidatus Omnitrophota bacterium]|nr:cytochrome c [Candidatus Omnitrophota bacterium]